MEFIVPRPMKALEALKIVFPESSRRTLQHWIKGGRFSLDGQIVEREDTPLEQGQVLRAQTSFSSKQSRGVKVLFEDRYFFAIDKPVGLLSVPLDGPGPSRNALDILRDYYQTDQIFAVHRIDRETSGVLLLARGTESRDRFKALFELHDLEREYFAIVEGRIPEEKGSWQCTLKELPNYDVGVAYDPDDGKEAITHFEVVRRSPKYSYLRLFLETGRKHQIRVHCKRAGFPVLGDRRYGSFEDPIRRLCLHARRIAFAHPFTKKRMSFLSPLPIAFKKLVSDPELFEKTNSLHRL